MQLLDEVNDGGYAFDLEPNILQELIAPPSFISKITDKVIGPGNSITNVLPEGSLSNIYWRRANAKYAKSEIYFDLHEYIYATIDRNGLLTTSEVHGEVLV